MMLGTQACNFLDQRLQNHLRERNECDSIMQSNNTAQSSNLVKSNQEFEQKDSKVKTMTSSSSASTSLFTIDSILASKPVGFNTEYFKSESRSPSNSPPPICAPSSLRPARVTAMLHPGIQLTHLAAAAASSFGAPSDFLGKHYEIEIQYSPQVRVIFRMRIIN